MCLITVFVFLWTGLTVNSEKHSLIHIYTGFSKPVRLPGIYEFSAVGLLDGRMIDYYDSDNKTIVPKQDWMKERLHPDYLQKGKEFHLSKQQWFRDSMDILKKQMNQNDDGLHVLQCISGCEGETGPNGTLTFVRGVDKYGYDGEDFLYFDDTKSDWDVAAGIPFQIKMKWDHMGLKEFTKSYLENKCMDWLNKFIKYGKKQLKKASPPDVYTFTKNTRIKSTLMLTCLATGFYAKDIVLNIKRNSRVLTKEDGLMSSGVQPNGDDTYQRRDSVEILKSDTSTFTCEVIHRGTRTSVEVWDHKVDEEGNNMGLIVGGVIAGLTIFIIQTAVVLAIVDKRINEKIRSGYRESLNSDNTSSADCDSGSRESASITSSTNSDYRIVVPPSTRDSEKKLDI